MKLWGRVVDEIVVEASRVKPKKIKGWRQISPEAGCGARVDDAGNRIDFLVGSKRHNERLRGQIIAFSRRLFRRGCDFKGKNLPFYPGIVSDLEKGIPGLGEALAKLTMGNNNGRVGICRR